MVLLGSCTKNNLDFGAPIDLAVEADLAASDLDLAVPSDLPPASDLPLVPPPDFSTVPPDLARGDLLIRCGGLACAGCCVNGQCRAFGDTCATPAEVCTTSGCAACGGNGQPCCALLLCGAGLICNTGMCRSCGGPGQMCCAGG